MIYLTIVITFMILSYISERIVYGLDNYMDKNLTNKILIFLPNMIIPILIYTKYELSIQSISYMALIPFLTMVSIIDLRTTYVYDITILSGIIMQSVIFLLDKQLIRGSMSNIKGLFIGMVLSYILAKATKSLGDGDIGFYGLCAFVLGQEYSLYMIFLSFMLASIYGGYILLRKKKSIKSSIPFTPFISLATILIILTQKDIINLYFDILSRNL
ncbi:MAG TPA: prepilin peptidase [Terrisporobacter glycolicus]|nr:A24 family peptidase [Terrisporobacter sp.]MBN9647808.1 prepilin peptidase [Terrisporobacter glycolicus]HBI93382.1 prepilin peptidase [Terrisporobacter hibernicus]